MTSRKDDPARELEAYLRKWIENDDKQRALRPLVWSMLGTSTWQIGALDTLRSKSPGVAGELDPEIASRLHNWKRALPLPREYDTDDIAEMTSVSAATSNAQIFEMLASIRSSEAASSPQHKGLGLDQILRIEDVQKVVGKSAATIYRDMKAGKFPQSVQLGENSIGWLASSIEKWIAARPARVKKPKSA
jgi:prophage regulatory protein